MIQMVHERETQRILRMLEHKMIPLEDARRIFINDPYEMVKKIDGIVFSQPFTIKVK